MNLYEGFFVSCFKGKDTQATRECTKILEILSEENHIYDEEIDFEATMRDEIKKFLKIKREFNVIKIKNLSNIIIIKNESKNSSYSLFCNMLENDLQTRYIHRLVPLEFIGDVSNYEKILGKLLEKIDFNQLDENSTFKIEYEGRICNIDIKEKIFKYLDGKITLCVKLKNPTYLLVVQVCKNLIGCSFLRNPNNNFNFNKS